MNPFPPPHHCGVKICGITSAEQALAVSGLGADALGLNFWPRSKRYVSAAAVAGWDLSLVKAALVAVTVNAGLEELRAIRELTPVQMLQLHGDEGPAEVELAMSLGLPVIKALQVKDAGSLDCIQDFPCATLLLDSYNPGSYGGEGKQFPWELLLQAKQRYPERQFILAGGLTPENVAMAVAGAAPAAVDVASGVESGPGVKDLAKTQRFISAAHAHLS